PFGAIDPINREAIQDEFLRMQKVLRKTIIFVSHDLDEAVKMADKIAIFRDGRLEQFSSPEQLLARPGNAFIENFLGSDRALKRLGLVRVDDAILASCDTVRAGDPVSRADDLMRAGGSSAIFMVGAEGGPEGVVFADAGPGRSGTVADHARPISAAVSVDADLRNAVALMFANDMPVLPCVDDQGRLKGALTFRSIVKSLADGEAPP
ncbi:MAG: CBS domain-containing protein, partial [Alphaproteobacteria bacterium]